MRREQKIIAAITTAVYAYLEAEQAAVSAQQVQPQTEPQPALPVLSPWALAGRQAVMERRYQMQFRAFR